MLPTLKKLGFIWVTGLFCGAGFAAIEPAKIDGAKPDLQKVYNEAMTWSKTKLEARPNSDQTNDIANIGVCVGSSVGAPLQIKPPCKKDQQLAAVLDDVTDDGKTPESRRNVHPDILSGSTNPPLTKLLVFVSFSMPKASLKALAKEADKHNAVLVMQGLKDDSFRDTQATFQELIGEELVKGGEGGEQMGDNQAQGFEVNPELFKTYKITKVPVFVLVKGTQEISRLSGNVSLSFAAKKLQGNT